MRKKYPSGTGLLNKFRANQLSKEGYFTFQESSLIKLNDCLLEWFGIIISEKKKLKLRPVIHSYDLNQYAPQLKNIFQKQMKGGKNRYE